jgi:hypothetical protein
VSDEIYNLGEPQLVPTKKKKHVYDRVRRLRLKRGDVIVCHDVQDAHNLARMRWPYISFQVPIVCAPGGIEQLPIEALRQILREAETCSQLIIPK